MEKEKIKNSTLCRGKTFRNASVKLYLVKTKFVSCMYVAIILVVFLVSKQKSGGICFEINTAIHKGCCFRTTLTISFFRERGGWCLSAQEPETHLA